MLEALARFDIRFRWPIVALWVIGAVAAARLLPGLATVTTSNTSQFLPRSAPSQHALDLAAPLQPPNAVFNAILVASRPGSSLTIADDAAVDNIERTIAALPGVISVRDSGTSADGQARKAVIATQPTSSGGNPSLVSRVRQAMAAALAPAGLTLNLTGPLAQSADSAAATQQTGSIIRLSLVVFVILLLFVVYRSVLAPLVTLLPALLSVLLAGPLITAASKVGLPVSTATQLLLPVLLIGAGTDYGLFLVYRVREEVRRGASPNDALIRAMGRVGLSIAFSALTVVVALACLIVATFSLYHGLGPSLALGLLVMLAAALTLLPALLSIFGRIIFWPSHPVAGQATTGLWGRLAARIVRRPLLVLLAGVIVFTVLSAGLTGFSVGGFTSGGPPSGTDSAAGTAALDAHYPVANSNPEVVVFHFAASVWDHPDSIASAQDDLASASAFNSVTGPLNPTGQAMSLDQLVSLHARAGVSPTLGQFFSADGQTFQVLAVPAAGVAGSQAAIKSVPAMRTAAAAAAKAAGAQDYGLVGQDPVAYDIAQASTNDLQAVVPVVLVTIALLLAVVLRSVVAPVYLIGTVGLSYLATLGSASFLFVRLGGQGGLNFVIPVLLFIFATALGEDYNILLMTRVREEAQARPLTEAVVEAIEHTGGTITSAGLILAGTFAVLGVASNNDQGHQLGFTISFAVLLDTFFVRTLLVPSAAVLLGRWNWWPSTLSRTAVAGE